MERDLSELRKSAVYWTIQMDGWMETYMSSPTN